MASLALLHSSGNVAVRLIQEYLNEGILQHVKVLV